jgi:acetolactate synthase regulatory subunit
MWMELLPVWTHLMWMELLDVASRCTFYNAAVRRSTFFEFRQIEIKVFVDSHRFANIDTAQLTRKFDINVIKLGWGTSVA